MASYARNSTDIQNHFCHLRLVTRESHTSPASGDTKLNSPAGWDGGCVLETTRQERAPTAVFGEHNPPHLHSNPAERSEWPFHRREAAAGNARFAQWNNDGKRWTRIQTLLSSKLPFPHLMLSHQVEVIITCFILPSLFIREVTHMLPPVEVMSSCNLQKAWWCNDPPH